MKRYIILFFVVVMSHLVANAQDDFIRGVMAIHDNDVVLARFHLEQAVKDDPTIGYAHALLSYVYFEFGLYNEAMEAADKALSLQHTDSDSKFLAYKYRALAATKLASFLSDKAEKVAVKKHAVSDLTMALMNKTDVSILKERARLYLGLDMPMESYADCKLALTSTPNDPGIYLLMGEACSEMKQSKEAISHYTKGIELQPNHLKCWLFRAIEYVKLSKYDLFASDVIESFNCAKSDVILKYLDTLKGSSNISKAIFNEIDSRIERATDLKNEPLLAGMIMEGNNDFVSAIKYYKKNTLEENSDIVTTSIIHCYMSLGGYSQALAVLDTIKNVTPINNTYLRLKLSCYNSLGDLNAALTEVNKLIELQPEDYFLYYMRGIINYDMGNKENALDSYSLAVSMAPERDYPLFSRGRMYYILGDKESANADFKRVLEINNDTANFNCSVFADYYLGNIDRAKERCQLMLAKSNSEGNNYDAACLYSLLGDKSRALDYLEIALEKGYADFEHIERDSDLDNIRKERSFIKLVNKHKSYRDNRLKMLR